MTADHALALVGLLFNAGILLVAVGRWGGRLESRRKQSIAAPEPAAPGATDAPSLGELTRRFEEFHEERRTLVRSGDLEMRLKSRDEVADVQRREIWNEIKQLKDMDTAQQRRFDALDRRIDDALGKR